ncbi:hypothetical protein PS712_05442 [Pseudomonas fluorescens]|uniref:Uncharacterized protein n=1 Tax=Pseudomonas fluorescens TaxID=294 RepID=A0A5E7FAU1_PSEFL|nr:hypothetical protein PS712_05442 [Pseudomonas fluorescens]
MEVVKLLLFTFCLVDPRQRRITPRLVQVQTALPRTLLAQHAQALPQEVFLLGYAINNGLLTDPPPQAVVPIRTGTFQLAIDQRLGLDQAIFTVINKRLQFAHATAFFNQVAPRIVGIFLIPPAFEAVVFDVIELAGVEIQPVRRGVVAEFFAVDQLPSVTAVQLAVGFVFVLDLAAQFIEGADQFAGRVVLVTAVDRVVGVFDQQVGLDAGVVDAREFFCRQARSKLPTLATHGVVTEAAGERALGAQHFAVQVVALDVADQLAVEVELVQVAAAVVQVIEVLAGGQRQRGEVAQWIVFVGQGALRRSLLDQSAEQVVGEFERFFADADLLALRGRQALDRQQTVAVVIRIILTGIGIELGQQPANAVALELGTALWPFTAFAVARFIDLRQMTAEVVAEASGQVVDAFFFDQSVGRIVGKLIRRVVFVDQCSQANRRVVFVADALALGVLTTARQTTGGT